MHPQDKIDQRWIDLGTPGLGVREQFVHIFVAKAMITQYHRSLYFAVDGYTRFGEFDPHRFGVAWLLRLQTGKVIRDDLWKHRDNAVWQVNTRRAVSSFLVKW